MPYTHPNHKQVTNNLMDDFHRDGVILMLIFQGYTSKQNSDLSLFFILSALVYLYYHLFKVDYILHLCAKSLIFIILII